MLRTIDAVYGLPKSGAQQPNPTFSTTSRVTDPAGRERWVNAAGAGIGDDTIVSDIFEPVK
jgi:hypothetical protein